MKICTELRAIKYKTMYNTLRYLNRNNTAVKEYQEEGFNILRSKVDKLPDELAFKPKFLKQSFCVKVMGKMYVFISKCHLNEPKETKFDALFHEIGHWLHFQNMPPLNERIKIWARVDKEEIKKEVSERAIQRKDGRELVAEVFKGMVKGKIYPENIMKIYRELNGPKVKQ